MDLERKVRKFLKLGRDVKCIKGKDIPNLIKARHLQFMLFIREQRYLTVIAEDKGIDIGGQKEYEIANAEWDDNDFKLQDSYWLTRSGEVLADSIGDPTREAWNEAYRSYVEKVEKYFGREG